MIGILLIFKNISYIKDTLPIFRKSLNLMPYSQDISLKTKSFQTSTLSLMSMSEREKINFYHDILDKVPIKLTKLEANIIFHYAVSIGKKGFLSSKFFFQLQRIEEEKLSNLLQTISHQHESCGKQK